MRTVDLDLIPSSGPRRKRAQAMLEAMVTAGRDVLPEGPAVAFVVVAEGNADLDAGTLGDVLAVAVLRLAERGEHV